jgi:hypothetical protein
MVSDSVVATATLRYSGSSLELIVAWGDGARTRTSSPIASVPGRPVPTAGTVSSNTCSPFGQRRRVHQARQRPESGGDKGHTGLANRICSST